MAHSMWPNMMPRNMPSNIAQGGSICPFFPPLYQTRGSFKQFMPSFPSSQNFLNDQFWMGQANIMGSQIWRGPQLSQVWRGEQSNFTEMMKNTKNAEE